MSGKRDVRRSADRINTSIDRLNLKKVLDKATREHRWSRRRRTSAERWYRRFLWLSFRHGKRPLAAISRDADFLWHDHILDTRTYAADCQRLFGRYLHHTPIYGRPRRAHRTSFERSKRLYLEEFGELPPDLGDICIAPAGPPPPPPPVRS